MFSRRELLIGTTTLALNTEALAWLPHGKPPVTYFNGHKSQMNLYTGENPFTNVFKNAGVWHYSNNALFDMQYLDTDGYPTSHINDGGNIWVYVNMPNQTQRPGDYIIRGDGTGTFSILKGPNSPSPYGSLIGPQSVSGSGWHYQFTPNSDYTSGYLIILQISSSSSAPNNIRNISICNVNDCDASGVATSTFQTRWLNLMKSCGVLRFMDFQTTNSNMVTKWSDRTPQTYYSYEAAQNPGLFKSSYFAGIASPQISGNAHTTLNGAIGSSDTSIVLTSGAALPSGGGQVLIDSEYITYSGITGNTMTVTARGFHSWDSTNYAGAAAAHSNGATVTLWNANNLAYGITGATNFNGGSAYTPKDRDTMFVQFTAGTGYGSPLTIQTATKGTSTVLGFSSDPSLLFSAGMQIYLTDNNSGNIFPDHLSWILTTVSGVNVDGANTVTIPINTSADTGAFTVRALAYPVSTLSVNGGPAIPFGFDNQIVTYNPVHSTNVGGRPVWCTLVYDGATNVWVCRGNTSGSQAGVTPGWPVEALVELANDAGAHPWFCIPINCCSSATEVATFTATGSGTNLTVSGVTGAISAGNLLFGNGVIPDTYIVSGGPTVYVTSNPTTCSGDSLTARNVMTSPISDYTSSLATYLKANLKAGLIPRFEPANEIWNDRQPITGGTYPVQARRLFASYGSAAYDNSHGNYVYGRDGWYGQALSQIGQAISAVYSGDMTKYNVICGIQGGDGLDGHIDRLAAQAYVHNNSDSASYAG